MIAIVQREPFAAGLPFAGRHRLVGDEQVVQPARPGEPHFISSVEHGGGGAQQRARAVERDRLQEGFRRQARPAAEQMMQLGRGDADRVRDLLDLGLLAPLLRDEADGLADDVVVACRRVQRREVGNAIGREHGVLHHLLPI